MILSGQIRDKDGKGISHALVEIKDEQFQTIYRAESDENGYYHMDVPWGKYPFLTAVRDYGKDYLEYWCQNLEIAQDMTLNPTFDTLEVYGLHAFEIKGAYPAVMAYFRPMSLKKFQRGEADIAPDIETIRATIDGCEAALLSTNTVQESIGEQKLTAFLIQIEKPEGVKAWRRLDIEIRDNSGSYGAATIFND